MRFFSDRDEQTEAKDDPAPAQRQPEGAPITPVFVPPDRSGASADADRWDRPTRTDDADPPEPAPQPDPIGAADPVAKPFFGTEAERTAAEPTNSDRMPTADQPGIRDDEPGIRDDEPGIRDDEPGIRDDEFAFHEPPPQPTAFGATTVGAAAAMAGTGAAGVEHLDRDRRTNHPETDDGPREQRPDDNPRSDQARSTAPGWGGEPDATTADGASGFRPAGDAAVVATPGDGEARSTGDTAGSGSSDADGQLSTGDTAAGTTVGGGQLPGPTQAAVVAPLFADDQAHQIRDRWREVQLRFIDDPRAAAEEARELIDEAVDTLTAGLRAQKDQLGAGAGTDTEELRILIRRYRDFLDHLLGL